MNMGEDAIAARGSTVPVKTEEADRKTVDIRPLGLRHVGRRAVPREPQDGGVSRPYVSNAPRGAAVIRAALVGVVASVMIEAVIWSPLARGIEVEKVRHVRVAERVVVDDFSGLSALEEIPSRTEIQSDAVTSLWRDGVVSNYIPNGGDLREDEFGVYVRNRVVDDVGQSHRVDVIPRRLAIVIKQDRSGEPFLAEFEDATATGRYVGPELSLVSLDGKAVGADGVEHGSANADDTHKPKRDLPSGKFSAVAGGVGRPPLLAQIGLVVGLGLAAYLLIGVSATITAPDDRGLVLGVGIGLLLTLVMGVAVTVIGSA